MIRREIWVIVVKGAISFYRLINVDFDRWSGALYDVDTREKLCWWLRWRGVIMFIVLGLGFRVSSRCWMFVTVVLVCRFL